MTKFPFYLFGISVVTAILSLACAGTPCVESEGKTCDEEPTCSGTDDDIVGVYQTGESDLSNNVQETGGGSNPCYADGVYLTLNIGTVLSTTTSSTVAFGGSFTLSGYVTERDGSSTCNLVDRYGTLTYGIVEGSLDGFDNVDLTVTLAQSEECNGEVLAHATGELLRDASTGAPLRMDLTWDGDPTWDIGQDGCGCGELDFQNYSWNFDYVSPTGTTGTSQWSTGSCADGATSISCVEEDTGDSGDTGDTGDTGTTETAGDILNAIPPKPTGWAGDILITPAKAQALANIVRTEASKNPTNWQIAMTERWNTAFAPIPATSTSPAQPPPANAFTGMGLGLLVPIPEGSTLSPNDVVKINGQEVINAMAVDPARRAAIEQIAEQVLNGTISLNDATWLVHMVLRPKIPTPEQAILE